MAGEGRPVRALRATVLSALSAGLAPLVLIGIYVFRKLAPPLHHRFHFWNERLQREIARWT